MITFEVCDKWEKKIKKWKKNHDCEFRTYEPFSDKTGRYVGCCGGDDTYCFTPTSIGTVLTVRCACGEEISFDDF